VSDLLVATEIGISPQITFWADPSEGVQYHITSAAQHGRIEVLVGYDGDEPYYGWACHFEGPCDYPFLGNTAIFHPDEGYVGLDSFTFKACNNSGCSANGTVSIQINEPIGGIVAVADTLDLQGEASAQINLVANDSYQDINSVNLSILQDPACGDISNQGLPTGWVQYDSAGCGSDSFIYQICDAVFGCSSATVTVTDSGGGLAYNIVVSPETLELNCYGSPLQCGDGVAFYVTHDDMSDPSGYAVDCSSADPGDPCNYVTYTFLDSPGQDAFTLISTNLNDVPIGTYTLQFSVIDVDALNASDSTIVTLNVNP